MTPAGGVRRVLPVIVAVSLLFAGACAPSTAPEVPAGPDGRVDEVLVQGRDLHLRRCASCHGAAGGGGRGPAFDERLLERYPTIEDHVELVANGRGGMPAFADALDEDELVAVVRYSREVLAGG
jgi:mono/diheme cytochrome c family protein